MPAVPICYKIRVTRKGRRPTGGHLGVAGTALAMFRLGNSYVCLAMGRGSLSGAQNHWASGCKPGSITMKNVRRDYARMPTVL